MLTHIHAIDQHTSTQFVVETGNNTQLTANALPLDEGESRYWWPARVTGLHLKTDGRNYGEREITLSEWLWASNWAWNASSDADQAMGAPTEVAAWHLHESTENLRPAKNEKWKFLPRSYVKTCVVKIKRRALIYFGLLL